MTLVRNYLERQTVHQREVSPEEPEVSLSVAGHEEVVRRSTVDRRHHGSHRVVPVVPDT